MSAATGVGGGTGALALAGLRGHARRLGATVLAVVLGVAFVTTTLLALNSLDRGVQDTVAGAVSGHDLVVTGGSESLTPDTVAALRAIEGVDVADASARVYGTGETNLPMLATTMPQGRGVALLDGRLPAGPDEVAVSVELARTSGAEPGDTVTFTPYPAFGDDGEEVAGEEPAALHPTVVGVVDVGDDPRLTWQDVIVGSEDGLAAWGGVEFEHVTLDLAGASEADARAAVEAAAPGTTLRTGTEEAAFRVANATGGMDLLGPVLLGFGAVALATTALVIANTFTIVLAQRSRELALLRCVGATRSQVRRTVLLEALVLGVVSSTLGVLVGVGAVAAAASAIGEVDLGIPVELGLVPSTTALVAPWLVGLVVTVGAAWWPTRRATRVAPLAALQPTAAPTAGSRPGLVRIAGSFGLLAAGAAALVYAVSAGSVVVGVLGGLVSFLGVLVGAVFLVPAAIRVLGIPARAAGVPGRLAVGNAVSNPARVAATSAALLIGVTLITMTSVGAASAARTADREIDAQFPLDVAVQASYDWPEAAPGQDPEEVGAVLRSLEAPVVDQVRALDGVQAAVPLPGAFLSLEQGDGELLAESPAYGVDATQVASALRDDSVLDDLGPGTLGMSEDDLSMYGLEAGQAVTVRGPAGSREVTLVEAGLGSGWLVSPQTLEELALDARTGAIAIRLADDADVGSVVTDIRSVVEPEGAWADGAAALRQEMDTVLNVLVLVTTGLLGVAVLIAVVGIANTLALSVLERTRENALVRALGLTRAQLRAMLTTEGILVAVVSAVLGVLLGTVYAWCGVQTLLPEDTAVALALPWGQLGAVLGVAVVAGLLASVLPARRAARIAPAAGLAAP
ncbi:ABC transporter permease [Ornithinicoccus hortensis]|uniref:Putative ABC transport system permease protein n=1 Tax=Ornithinicoccus hortensis TaxID=82346 RepID=A0A542YLY3_9MICO|nr:ABC transporter permease [Ornithinicoccus hortensis]TQL49106.1 putative ABC transport system permease protein [Ornithinicoccus hortensis]